MSHDVNLDVLYCGEDLQDPPTWRSYILIDVFYINQQ